LLGIDVFCLWLADIKNGGIKSKKDVKDTKNDEDCSIRPSLKRALHAARAKCENKSTRTKQALSGEEVR